MKQKLLFFTVMALAGSLLISCKKDTVIPAPTITSFTPTEGAVAVPVTITGTNFSATAASNTVLFNGTAAVVTASTTTDITTTVPVGATTGTITVAVGGQIATSTASFTIIPPPTITSFTPTNGVLAGTVTITGTNFSATAVSNIVKFNGTAAVVTASTTTSITTTVPAGATTGTITVTVGTQSATSATSFRVDALFKATLLGINEVAPNNTSTATGLATLTFNLETKIFTIVTTYTGLTGAATNAHIHKGVAGVVGSVVYPFASPFTSPISYTSVALTAAQEIDLNAGSYYVNVHSAAFPVGEIRGFLIKQ